MYDLGCEDTGNSPVLCSAAGCAIPPLVIFSTGTYLKVWWWGKCLIQCMGSTPIVDGWWDLHRVVPLTLSCLYYCWSTSAPPAWRLLLSLQSRVCWARCEPQNNGVCLPPNTTHVCQLLDSTWSRSLKVFWNETCDDYMCCHPGKVVTIYQFSAMGLSVPLNVLAMRSQ